LNHEVSIKDIQLLAAAGYFPKYLASCNRPQCCECHFRKACKNAWKFKLQNTNQILQHMKKTPGSVAHTDIMTLSIGGLIPQMIGFLTRERFFHTHIFVDDISDLTFAYHTKTTNVDEALEAK